jgi:hypothetical protein
MFLEAGVTCTVTPAGDQLTVTLDDGTRAIELVGTIDELEHLTADIRRRAYVARYPALAR